MLDGLKGKFSVVYADPPWKYSNSGVNGAAQKHYPVMSTKDICALDVRAHIADNAALFLWATWPNLPEAFKVMEAWGFKYKSAAFLWVKMMRSFTKAVHGAYSDGVLNPDLAAMQKLSDHTAFGPGFYTRANSEVCLLGTRGSFKPVKRDVRQVVFSERGRHSEKPDEVRTRIDILAGDKRNKVELFARKRVEGWSAWGHGVDANVV